MMAPLLIREPRCRRTQPPDRRDAEIQKLQANLHCARATIVDLVPKPHRDWLEMATLCGNFKDFDAWQAWAIDGLTRGAYARPGPEMGGVVGQFRAFCPLCGEGSQALGLLGNVDADRIGAAPRLQPWKPHVPGLRGRPRQCH